MTFNCNFCDKNFTQKHILQRHITDNKCKSVLIRDFNKINDFIQKQRNEIQKLKQHNITNINGINSIGNNNINMKIEININPITKLDIKHIEYDKLKQIIENIIEKNLNIDMKLSLINK